MHALRSHAVAHSLFAATNLEAAIARLGFVQADPIRAPATAQDLILRHRVEGYRVGDLARAYPEIGLEEGMLYAYGFMPRAIWRLWQLELDEATLPEFERGILSAVRQAGPSHPSALAREFGSHGIKNAWGGNSRAVAHALDHLQWQGLLRVASREKGIRIYGAAPPPDGDRPEVNERLRQLIMLGARLMAPVQENLLVWIGRRIHHLGKMKDLEAISARTAVGQLVKSGELESRVVDGVTYLWPAGTALYDEAPRVVRILAPFDPVVWDRKRFEHFWGWEYRFEAYVPAPKRVRGYYAMPLLWGEEAIGWVNASTTGGAFSAEVGYVDKQPREKGFTRELRAELGRLEQFLKPVA